MGDGDGGGGGVDFRTVRRLFVVGGISSCISELSGRFWVLVVSLVALGETVFGVSNLAANELLVFRDLLG